MPNAKSNDGLFVSLVRETHGFIGIAALLTVYFVWGSTYLAIRVAVRNIPPLMMTGWRFLIAGIVLYSFLRIRGRRAPSMVQWRAAALAGLLMLVLGNGGLAFSEQRIGSGLAALVVASVPLWAAIFAGLWGKWPGGLEWTGLTLGTLGIVLLHLNAGLRGSPTAAIVLLFASASFALGSVWSSRLSLPDGLMGSASEMLASGGMLVLLSILKGDRLRTVPPLASVLSFAYLIVFGSLIAYSAYVYLVRHLRPTLATSYAFVNPIVAVALAAPILGESITVTEILAMIVILAGVALVLSGQRNRVKASEPPGSLANHSPDERPRVEPRIQQSTTRRCCEL
jgi:drug/metabolite transporter (DMT)-like permease